MLSLIGLGLRSDDLTQRGRQAMQQADKVYAEFYTNTAHDVSAIEKASGRTITALDRSAVEQENRIVEEARNQHIAFLVSGDPLAATTHYTLVQQLRQDNIQVDIIHNTSIFTAIAETGLSLYKFGRATTLPTPDDDYIPPSVYTAIATNQRAELHTLVLLDIDLSAAQAMNMLLYLERTQKQGILAEDTPVVAAARLGTDTATMTYTALGASSTLDLGVPPHCLIIPATLSHMEEEFLNADRH